MSYSTIFKSSYSRENIVYSIINPVYNQEDIIIQNINSYISNTIDNFEIIIILDSCSDNTKDKLLEFMNIFRCYNKYLIQIQIIETTEPLFETKCDNIGFKIAQGKYLLEIQADMEMTQYGYNMHLTKPFNLLPDVIAVSGRCAHNLFRTGGVGKTGSSYEKNVNEIKVDKNIFYTYETCNRGPLLLDKKKVKELGYLDEENYFLDNSDHDLMIRAYLFKRYICGYVPIDFNSPIANGSTRKKRDNKNAIAFIEYTNKMKKSYIDKYKKCWINLEPKQYNI